MAKSMLELLSEDSLFKVAEEKIEGGKADGHADSEYPKDQIEKGMEVEKEHIKDPQARKEIAKDHLQEEKEMNPDKKKDELEYYDELKGMEKKLEKDAFASGFEKAALMDKRWQEDLLAAGTELSFPIAGSAFHAGLAERPEGHSRTHEVLSRGAGTIGGSMLGAVLGKRLGGGRAMLPAATVGGLGGAVLGSRHSTGKYYDEKGNLKKEYGGKR